MSRIETDQQSFIVANVPEVLRKDVASVRASIDLSTRVSAATAATTVIPGLAGPPALPTDDLMTSMKLWLSLSSDPRAVAALIEDLLALLNDSRRIMEDKARSSGGGLPAVDQHLASSIVSTILFVTTGFLTPALAEPRGRIRQALKKWRDELAGRTKKAVVLPNEALACACLHRRAVAGDDLCRTMLLSSALCHRADTLVVAPPCPITLQRTLYAVNQYPFAWSVVADSVAEGARLDVPYDTVVHLLVQLPSLRRSHPTLSASLAQTLLLQLEQLLHLHPVPDPAFMLEALPPVLAIASGWPSPVGPSAARLAEFMEAEVASPGFCSRRHLLREFPLLLRRGTAHPDGGTGSIDESGVSSSRAAAGEQQEAPSGPLGGCTVNVKVRLPAVLQLDHGTATAGEMERADGAARKFAEAVRTVPVLCGSWDPFVSGLLHAWAAEDLGDRDACDDDEDDDVGAIELLDAVDPAELRARLPLLVAKELNLQSVCSTTGLCTSVLEDGVRLNVMESAICCDLDIDAGGFSALLTGLPRMDWQRWLARVLVIAQAGLHGPVPVLAISGTEDSVEWTPGPGQSPLDEAISAHRWRCWHLLCLIADLAKEQDHQQRLESSGKTSKERRNVTGVFSSEVGRDRTDGSASVDSDSSDDDGTPVQRPKAGAGSAPVRQLTMVDLEGCTVELWTKWARWSSHAAPARWTHHVVEEVRGLVFGESRWYTPQTAETEPADAASGAGTESAGYAGGASADPSDYLNLTVPQVAPPPLRLASMPLPLTLVADLSSGQATRRSRAGSSASVGRAGSQDSQRSLASKGMARRPGSSTTLESIALLDCAANASKRLDHAVSSLVELVTALQPEPSLLSVEGSAAGDRGAGAGAPAAMHRDITTQGGGAPSLPDGAVQPQPDDVRLQHGSDGPFVPSAVIHPAAELIVVPIVVAGNDVAVHGALTAIARACALHKHKTESVEWRLFVLPSPPGTHSSCLVHPSGRGEPLPSFSSPKGIASPSAASSTHTSSAPHVGRTGPHRAGGALAGSSPSSGSLAAQAARALGRNSVQVGSREWRLHHAIQAQCTLAQWLAATDPWYCREVYISFSQDSAVVPRLSRQMLSGPSYMSRHGRKSTAPHERQPRPIIKHAFETQPPAEDCVAASGGGGDDITAGEGGSHSDGGLYGSHGHSHVPVSLAQRSAASSSSGCGGVLGEEDLLSCGYVSGRLGLHTPLSQMRGLVHSYLRTATRNTPLKLFVVELDVVGGSDPLSHPMYQTVEESQGSGSSNGDGRTVRVIMFSSLEIGIRANAAWDQAKRFEGSAKSSKVPASRARSASVTEILASGMAAAVGAESHDSHAVNEAFRDDVLVSPERIEEYRKNGRHLTSPVRLSAAPPTDAAGSFEAAGLKEVLRNRLLTLRLSALPSAADLAHQEQRLRKQRQAQELTEVEGSTPATPDAGAISPQQAAQVELAASLIRESERLPMPGDGYVSARDLRKVLSGFGSRDTAGLLARQKKAAIDKKPLESDAQGTGAMQVTAQPIATMDSPWLVLTATDCEGPTARSIMTSIPTGPQLLDSLVTEEAESAACVMAAAIDVEAGTAGAGKGSQEGVAVLIDGEIVPTLVKRIRVMPMPDPPRIQVAHFM